jgi:hypothetical protein
MRSKIVLALCIVASLSAAPGCGDDESDPTDSSGASGSGAGVAGAAAGGVGAAGHSGGTMNGGDGPAGAGGSGELFSCAATPCGSGDICLASGSGDEVTESCVEDPCAPATLDCSCASELCPNDICLIHEGGVVCASR